MTAILTLTRYRNSYIFFALTAMGLFRPFLWFNNKFSFYRLLGCGRNGSFDIYPDWNQYGMFSLIEGNDYNADELQQNYSLWKRRYYGKFISSWWRFFGVETWTIVLRPVMSHGKWGGKEIVADPAFTYAGDQIAVLTRASIRWNKARTFWKNVPSVQQQMKTAGGLVFSVGIGEFPILRQATFSIWKDSESMKAFAYNMQQHKEVIRKTRDDNWYSEELFARFMILDESRETGQFGVECWALAVVIRLETRGERTQWEICYSSHMHIYKYSNVH